RDVSEHRVDVEVDVPRLPVVLEPFPHLLCLGRTEGPCFDALALDVDRREHPRTFCRPPAEELQRSFVVGFHQLARFQYFFSRSLGASSRSISRSHQGQQPISAAISRTVLPERRRRIRNWSVSVRRPRATSGPFPSSDSHFRY